MTSVDRLNRFLGKRINSFLSQFSLQVSTTTFDIRKFLQQYSPTIVIDVGANTGQFAIQVLKSGFSGTLVSIEPMSVAHAELVKSAKRYSNWHILPRMGIGDVPGIFKLNISENSVSSSLLNMSEVHLKAAPKSRYTQHEEVEVRTLDEALSNFSLENNFVFLKIDTQGYEENVLKGASKTLEVIDIVMIEVSIVPTYNQNFLSEETINFMNNMNFKLIDLNPVLRSQTNQLLQCDFIFLKRNKID